MSAIPAAAGPAPDHPKPDAAPRGQQRRRPGGPVATLYGARGSGSAAVEVALAMAGVPFDVVDAAPWDPPCAALDELRRANPLAQLPTLQLADGSVMTESAAILIQLGLEHPSSGLLPAEPAARAQAIRGLVFIVANCYAAIGIIDYPQRWCGDAADDDAMRKALVAGTRQRLHALWELFADAFAAASAPTADQRTPPPWLSGERLGALDVLAATVSKWSGARAHLQAARPGFHDLLLRIEAHPAVAPVWARHWPAAA